MKNTVAYEWSIESLEDEDIVDSDFSDTLNPQWLKDTMNNPKETQLCLVRTSGNDDDGVVDRQWAYVDEKTGLMPERFGKPTASGPYDQSGVKIPTKFHNELKKLCTKPSC